MSMPVAVSALRDLRHVCATEGRKIIRAYNNLGQVPVLSPGATSVTQWRAATPPTTTANAWYRAQAPLVIPVPGRAQVIYSIEVEVTAACDIAVSQFADRKQMLDASSGAALVEYFNAVHISSLPAAGKYRFEWPEGLVVRSGDRLDLYYLVTGTTGVNWQASASGYDITDDFDFDLPAILVIGDSIGGVTADTNDVKYMCREDGTKNGMWPFIVKGDLADLGSRYRIINLSVGGTSSADWDFMASSGRLDGLKAAAMVVNLGMNDASFATLLSTTAGVDGGTKRALKHLTRCFRRTNPSSPVVVNQITDTDTSGRLTSVAGGIYAGQTRLAAYRQDIAAAVTEMQAIGWPVSLAATNTAYSAASGTAFLSTESSGSRLHPNGGTGQPAMATIITTALRTALGIA